jgi:uncharacterized protein (TIGR03663 family)
MSNEIVNKPGSHIAATWLIVFAIGIAAFMFRSQQLELKPLHTDEAVQALKFGDLLEKGEYAYDPVEYHGPTLYYFSLPAAWVKGRQTLAQCGIDDLRLVPLVAGIGLIFLLLLVRGPLGDVESVVAAIFLSVSPIFFYYSRYYVQEMWLPFFLFGFLACGWHFLKTGAYKWAILTGLCLGLMHATKETFIISCGALGLAVIIDAFCNRAIVDDLRAISWWKIPVILLVAVLVSVVFFSSFFTHMRGPLDSVLTYQNYFGKGTEGLTGHEKDWHYYFTLLGWNRMGKGRVWSELFLLALAVPGLVFAFMGQVRGDRRLWRVIAIYALVLLGIYSLLAYKTPWLALNFMHPIILLAALGACGLVRLMPRAFLALLVIGGMGYGVYNLGVQSFRGNFKFHSDPRNPYAYTQTAPDLIKLVDRVKDIRALHPDKERMTVKIVGTEYWPLPWYLRDMPNVGYWRDALPDADLEAPIIIAAAEQQDALDAKLNGEYFVDFKGLRPGVILLVYIQQDLWDAYMESRSR